jgi:hypothetical protein
MKFKPPPQLNLGTLGLHRQLCGISENSTKQTQKQGTGKPKVHQGNYE